MDDERGSALRAGGGDQEVVYPVNFELRVIFRLSEGATLAADLKRVLSERGASPDEPRTLPTKAGTPEGKYGRMACRVTFADKESMYAAYAAVGALPGVKAVL